MTDFIHRLLLSGKGSRSALRYDLGKGVRLAFVRVPALIPGTRAAAGLAVPPAAPLAGYSSAHGLRSVLGFVCPFPCTWDNDAKRPKGYSCMDTQSLQLWGGVIKS